MPNSSSSAKPRSRSTSANEWAWLFPLHAIFQAFSAKIDTSISLVSGSSARHCKTLDGWVSLARVSDVVPPLGDKLILNMVCLLSFMCDGVAQGFWLNKHSPQVRNLLFEKTWCQVFGVKGTVRIMLFFTFVTISTRMRGRLFFRWISLLVKWICSSVTLGNNNAVKIGSYPA